MTIDSISSKQLLGKKVAIMQPYIFPYIGYFQLIDSVDCFVIYDDVAFIKRGWIARNQILLDGKAHFFSVTLDSPSQFKIINQTRLHNTEYFIWRNKFYKTLEHAYKHAPFYLEVIGLVKSVLEGESEYISSLARNSITSVCKYLDVKTEVVTSSSQYENSHLKGEERILDICKHERAGGYVNLPGGAHLYNPTDFSQVGIELKFIQPKCTEYKQFNQKFVPWLSIIDVLMFNSVSACKDLLKDYQFGIGEVRI